MKEKVMSASTPSNTLSEIELMQQLFILFSQHCITLGRRVHISINRHHKPEPVPMKSGLRLPEGDRQSDDECVDCRKTYTDNIAVLLLGDAQIIWPGFFEFLVDLFFTAVLRPRPHLLRVEKSVVSSCCWSIIIPQLLK